MMTVFTFRVPSSRPEASRSMWCAGLCALLLLSLATSCRKAAPSEPESVPEAAADSAAAVAAVAADSVPEPPVAADGLFDDFVYSFTKNRRFQLERIAFPLSITQDGTETKIESKDWKFTPLFTKGGVYTLIFDNLKAISAEKDTAVKHVVVENVYLSRDRVKQYVFDRLRGRWFLTAINEHAMADNVNSDFYRFYHRFSRSLQFQLAHIADPFAFKTYDSDNFQTIEGVLDAAQWPDYRPELPKGTITNINYGQAYGNARRRVLMICSQSGGMGCSLVFVRKGSTWMLESLEN